MAGLGIYVGSCCLVGCVRRRAPKSSLLLMQPSSSVALSTCMPGEPPPAVQLAMAWHAVLRYAALCYAVSMPATCGWGGHEGSGANCMLNSVC